MAHNKHHLFHAIEEELEQTLILFELTMEGEFPSFLREMNKLITIKIIAMSLYPNMPEENEETAKGFLIADLRFLVDSIYGQTIALTNYKKEMKQLSDLINGDKKEGEDRKIFHGDYGNPEQDFTLKLSLLNEILMHLRSMLRIVSTGKVKFKTPLSIRASNSPLTKNM